MCKHFDDNRAALARLIYSKKDSFSKDELVQEFYKKRKGDINIDGCQTIAQYLEDLAEYGALMYSNGKYRVRVSMQ